MNALVTLVGVFVLGTLFLMFIGWLVMLALGAAHSHDSVIPALSYSASIWVTVILRLITFDAVKTAK